METASSLGLPVGCHFELSDKELLLHFLYNKEHGLPLSCNAMMECDLYGNEETWRQLFDQTSERCLYFFIVLKKKTEKGSRANYVLCRVINKQKLQPRRQPRLIRGNVNQEIKSNIVSEVLYHEEQNDDEEEVDVGSEILKLLDQD
ncbi:hypothetical protein ACFX13_047847 [Malus domestica]